MRVPIVATETAEGGLRVQLGQRRTLAAIEAGRATVPVLVESGGDGEVDRIVDQFAENEHRTGLSAADRLGVVEQLTAFGVSPAQISKKLRVMKRPEVDAAIAVAASQLAKTAARAGRLPAGRAGQHRGPVAASVPERGRVVTAVRMYQTEARAALPSVTRRR